MSRRKGSCLDTKLLSQHLGVWSPRVDRQQSVGAGSPLSALGMQHLGVVLAVYHDYTGLTWWYMLDCRSLEKLNIYGGKKFALEGGEHMTYAYEW